MAPALEQIELACFPLANPDDLLDADDIRAYAATFPAGYLNLPGFHVVSIV